MCCVGSYIRDCSTQHCHDSRPQTSRARYEWKVTHVLLFLYFTFFVFIILTICTREGMIKGPFYHLQGSMLK